MEAQTASPRVLSNDNSLMDNLPTELLELVFSSLDKADIWIVRLACLTSSRFGISTLFEEPKIVGISGRPRARSTRSALSLVVLFAPTCPERSVRLDAVATSFQTDNGTLRSQ